MAYIDDQRLRAVRIREELFRDPGGGIFLGKPRPFILKDPQLNIWDRIREDAIAYFNEYEIPWWMGGKDNLPSGHLLSSQVACVNHLFWMRHRPNAAAAVLRNISKDFVSAEPIEDGLVAFEVIGAENYLGEKSHTRGANSTSIDAVMIARGANGKRTLVMIEWKYTEHYRVGEGKYIPARAGIYDPLLADPDCPIRVEDPEVLYYEPFYQLMRQTLLGWGMVQDEECGCSDYLHLHIIPAENRALRERVTSPGIRSKSMSEAWKEVLKSPDKYRVVTPEDFLEPAGKVMDTKAIFRYLEDRYW